MDRALRLCNIWHMLCLCFLCFSSFQKEGSGSFYRVMTSCGPCSDKSMSVETLRTDFYFSVAVRPYMLLSLGLVKNIESESQVAYLCFCCSYQQTSKEQYC